MAATLHYLTVQDVLWINLEATRRTQPFSYATLEEATYYQYAYGESNTLLPQAARFLSGFLKLHPFAAGNHVTAFVGVIAFVRANRYCVDLNDREALAWFDRGAASRAAALDALRQVATPDILDDEGHVQEDEHVQGRPDTRGFVKTTMIDFPATIRALVDRV